MKVSVDSAPDLKIEKLTDVIIKLTTTNTAGLTCTCTKAARM